MADGSTNGRVRTIRAADLFCGAGGTSTGAARAVRAMGAGLNLTAVNHWPVALETHAAMHPDAEHICADLESVRPREVVPEGRLDLLMASPTCTYHSRARGGRPVNDQQRMDPWHVHRWCCELRVARLLVENVPEMVQWGPCSLVTGRPIESRKGEYFRAWCAALQSIGFRLDWRILNCADYGDPTTRQRLFLIARSDGKALRWPEPTHARGGAVDLLGVRRPWRSAAECIDWGNRGTSIFARKRPLKPNTLRRLLAGAQRYHWPQPYVDALEALLNGREPRLEFSAVELEGYLGDTSMALVMAIGSDGAARCSDEPVPTIVGGGNGARPHFAHGVIVSKHGGPHNSARCVTQPLYAIDTAGGGSIAVPVVAPYYGRGSGLMPQRVAEPLPAEPIIVSTSNSSSTGIPRAAGEPLRTITTAKGGDMAIAAPIVVRAGHGDGDGRNPASRVLDVAAPLPALTGSNECALAQAYADEYRIDILYRMLTVRELARAMSFDVDGGVYPFAGNATQITKQIGNAVPCRTAEALVRALVTT